MKIITSIIIILLVHCVFANEKSRLFEVLIQSPSLQGNLLGESAERHVAVYLPPSYFTEQRRKYPVVYILPGNTPRNILGLFGKPTLDLMDSLVGEGKVKEMIVVQPYAWHRYGGCQYANSPVSGNWADFITKELVAYIDENYRTLPEAESRGLIGYSMGGRGVLDLALKFPGVYGVVYAMFPGQMGFGRFPRQGDVENWRELIISNDSDPDNRSLRRLLGFAVAFSPNPNAPPYFADFPMMLDGEVMRINEAVMRRWSQFDPVEIAANDASPLLKLNALYFDCGTSDSGLKAVRLFASILTKQNIPHNFQEYEGGHGDPGAVRFSTRVLPAVSKHLATE